MHVSLTLNYSSNGRLYSSTQYEHLVREARAHMQWISQVPRLYHLEEIAPR